MSVVRVKLVLFRITGSDLCVSWNGTHAFKKFGGNENATSIKKCGKRYEVKHTCPSGLMRRRWRFLPFCMPLRTNWLGCWVEARTRKSPSYCSRASAFCRVTWPTYQGSPTGSSECFCWSPLPLPSIIVCGVWDCCWCCWWNCWLGEKSTHWSWTPLCSGAGGCSWRSPVSRLCDEKHVLRRVKSNFCGLLGKIKAYWNSITYQRN